MAHLLKNSLKGKSIFAHLSRFKLKEKRRIKFSFAHGLVGWCKTCAKLLTVSSPLLINFLFIFIATYFQH